MTIRKPHIFGNRLLVRCKKEDRTFRENKGRYDEISDSGLVIATYTKDQLRNFNLDRHEVYVIQVGNECEEPWVKPGDLITCVRWSGIEIGEIGDGEYYKVINHDDSVVKWVGEEINV